MDKFEEFYKQHCLDRFGCNPDLNWIFEKHEDGSYIQIEVENAKKVFNHQQAKVEELQKRVDQQGLVIAKAMSIASDLQKSWSMFEIGKKLEQALKGQTND